MLDVGGTAIKIGAVSGATVTTAPPVPALAQESAPTIIAQLQRAIDDATACAKLVSDTPPSGLAIAFPGPFDLARGRPMLQGLGKFESIYGLDLGAELRTADTPLAFVRDSEAAAVGEARFGAGRAAHRVLTVALGTGFGACLTNDAIPVPSVDGQTIEALHELPTPDGRVDDVLSATGLARQLGVTAPELGLLLGGRRLEIDQRATIEAFAHRLGAFLATQHHLGANLIVVAGGLAGSFELFGDAVGAHVDTPVLAAQLGAEGPLLGAVHLAFPEAFG
ncbi:MAG: ROK family protein [Ilumatobacter sp.]|uniref:ROK family protein n=1 Tax=Ilumatobacter sp. TaxID=1967498 RepID=UPI003C75FCF3